MHTPAPCVEGPASGHIPAHSVDVSSPMYCTIQSTLLKFLSLPARPTHPGPLSKSPCAPPPPHAGSCPPWTLLSLLFCCSCPLCDRQFLSLTSLLPVTFLCTSMNIPVPSLDPFAPQGFALSSVDFPTCSGGPYCLVFRLSSPLWTLLSLIRTVTSVDSPVSSISSPVRFMDSPVSPADFVSSRSPLLYM